MKVISHRGNLIGPSNSENQPQRIQSILNERIDCEIDVWHTNQRFYLGHDFASMKLTLYFCNKVDCGVMLKI